MRRRVKVATTKRRRTLHGSVTNHYRYEQRGSRVAYRDEGQPADRSNMARFFAWQGRLYGIHPWNPLRFAMFMAVVGFGQGTVAGALVGLAAAMAAFVIWHREQRPAPVEAPARPKALPGSDWCDHCADWTVHPTERHWIAA